MSKYSAYFVLEPEIKKVTRGTVDRADLIADFTNQQKTSLSQLSEWEFKEFLKHLKTKFKINSDQKWKHTPENKMRRAIISIFKEMGYVKVNGSADMEKIDNWCLKYGVTHKLLNDNNKAELQQLVTQAKKVLKSYTQSINK